MRKMFVVYTPYADAFFPFETCGQAAYFCRDNGWCFFFELASPTWEAPRFQPVRAWRIQTRWDRSGFDLVDEPWEAVGSFQDDLRLMLEALERHIAETDGPPASQVNRGAAAFS